MRLVFSAAVVMAAASFVPGGAAPNASVSSSGPLLTYSVEYWIGPKPGGSRPGGLCATGPQGRSFRISDPYDDVDAAWSPNGKWIAFSRPTREDSAISHVVITDAQGRHGRNLPAGGNVNFGPAWSPDGTKLAFVGGWYGDTSSS